jgi:hypothetical protein
MANKKLKMKKVKARHLYRNAVAAPARAVPRAVVVRPRGPIASDGEEAQKQRDTPGWGALKAFGGALATTVAGAYLAQQSWVPPKVMTGVLSGLGALLALEGPEKWKSLGLGAMSAAGGQLGFMLIDDQLIQSPDDKTKGSDKKESAASKPSAPASGKRQAGDIPADALARAYERARLRMALTSDATN